jgi:hypothetical protein
MVPNIHKRRGYQRLESGDLQIDMREKDEKKLRVKGGGERNGPACVVPHFAG